jgi:uncharacterized LabA/DUF88 family protein
VGKQNEKPVTFAFIDSQNLNLGVRSLGWELDYRKFRLYLKNKYNVSTAFMFIGYVDGNQHIYTKLQQAGFILVYKTAVTYRKGGKKIIKGNVDAELVLHAAAIDFPSYEKAVIVTNDGDFSCLIDWLNVKGKLMKIIAPNKNYSSLFSPHIKKIVTLDTIKARLEKTKNGAAVGQIPKPTPNIAGSNGRSKP